MTERTGAGGEKARLPRYFKLFIAMGLVLLAIPSAASAQASRTWVSGVGDDANPCSRTAPCKTFAGAISKTATTGEINCLDPGGFGAVTITKAITINCKNTEAGVLAGGTGVNGIIINASTTSNVILRGLDIFGFSNAASGIKVFAAKRVKVYDTDISGFQHGFDFQPSTERTKGLIRNSVIEDSRGNAVQVAPTATGNARVTIKNSTIAGNNCGVIASSVGAPGSASANTDCGTAGGVGGNAQVNVFGSEIVDNEERGGPNGSAGVFTAGSGAIARIGDNEITGNIFGIRSISPAPGGIFSFGNNYIFGNTTDGTPTGTITPTRR